MTALVALAMTRCRMPCDDGSPRREKCYYGAVQVRTLAFRLIIKSEASAHDTLAIMKRAISRKEYVARRRGRLRWAAADVTACR